MNKTIVNKKQVVIVGSGIIGLAHALMAREAGYEVVVFERNARPLGATIRNFGTIWPIGCVPGPERDQALFGAAYWRDLAKRAGIWHDECGSLSLAYREAAWQVLQEFSSSLGDENGYELLARDQVLQRFPAANPDGLRGALRGEAELVLHTPSATPLLVDFIRAQGVVFHFGTPVVRVHESEVETSAGERYFFDHLLIAAGEEMRLLFPKELQEAEIQPCRLQMMRTVPQPEGFRLGAIMVSDLTLCHYPAFRDCPSVAILRQQIESELPDHIKQGVHVIAAQHQDGTLTIGDSHEYGNDLDPASHDCVDDLILDTLATFVGLPDPRVATRWQGTYLKSTRGVTQVVLHPRENVTMVTAMGGLGMTLSWGLAKKTVEHWVTRDS
jgi:D-hydroxyproline dehydrogenase subunit beta